MNIPARFRSKSTALDYLSAHETYNDMYAVNISLDRITALRGVPLSEYEQEAFDWLFSQDMGLSALWDLSLSIMCKEWEDAHAPHEVFTEGRQGKHLCLSASTLTPYTESRQWRREVPLAVAVSDANTLRDFDLLACTLANETVQFAVDQYALHEESEAAQAKANAEATVFPTYAEGDVLAHVRLLPGFDDEMINLGTSGYSLHVHQDDDETIHVLVVK